MLEAMPAGISVTGVVTAPWAGECRRCLVTATGTLTVPVRELYTEDGDGEDAYPLADDEVDLEDLVHDAVLLELPHRPASAGGLPGLCPCAA